MASVTFNFESAYTYVRAAVTTAYATITTASVIVEQAEKLPFMMMYPIGDVDIREAENLERNDNVCELSVQIEVFATKMTECRGITSVINGAMKTLGFEREYQAPIDNIDKSVNRIVSRYRRIVCDTDTITL